MKLRLRIDPRTLAFLLVAANLQAAAPNLANILPRGHQRGTETDLNFHGQRLEDAAEALFFDAAIQTLKLEVVSASHVRVRARIAENCRLGEHSVRLRTRSGISELRTFFVDALPAIDEAEPNNEFGTPQEISLNSIVRGVVKNEDVDYYSVSLKKGQRLSVEVHAMRLAETIFDPYVAILNAQRFELAASDDSPLYKQDSACQITAPEDGVYRIEVRETSYGGGDAARYRLHVGTFPQPKAIYPPGAQRGASVEVELIGDASGPFGKLLQIARDAPENYEVTADDDRGIAPTPYPFRTADFPNVLEAEPNREHKQATSGTAPCAFNGVISEPGDVDVFSFAAKKGQVFDLEVFARRLGSPLDAVLRVHHRGGGQIASDDDARGPDSYLRFTAPEDKEYAVTVTDHLAQGGPTYVYRVEVSNVTPHLALSIPRVDRYSQERQAIAVPSGNRVAVLVNANRRDFGGDLTLSLHGAPPGVTARGEVMPANLTVAPMLLEAAADAALSGRLCELQGSHVDASKKIHGSLAVPIDFLVGEPGQSVYVSHTTRKLAVAVTEAAPFRLRLVEPSVPLVRNGSMGLRVVAERADGFKAPIELDMIFQPPGVSAQRGVTIAEGQTDATIQINANGSAQIREWKIVVNGRATVGNGPLWVSTQLTPLRVAEPYLTITAEPSSAEQGTETEVVCKLAQHTPFKGAAKVALLGLPHKVTTEVQQATSETQELVFPVRIAADSPAGKHGNIFCRVEIVQNGEPVVHSTGGTELRIDKPLPPPKAKTPAADVAVAKPAPKPKPTPKPLPKPTKRLSRLEKLREAYKQQNQNSGTDSQK